MRRIIAGFTGSRHGVSDRQNARLRKLLEDRARVLHHGDCIGADWRAHRWAQRYGVDVVVHPPTNPEFRAYCLSLDVLSPKPYLERDRDIVKACSLLIAMPNTYEPTPRSGTWYTIGYARQVRKRTLVIFPNGSEESS